MNKTTSSAVLNGDIPLTEEDIEAFGLEEATDDAGPSWQEIANTQNEGKSYG